jgi:O-antigen/teichoic acid export membrane protein
VSSIVGFMFLFTPWKKPAQPVRESTAEAGAMVPIALPFWRQSLVAGFSSDIDLWFVQALIGSAATGVYGAAAALAEITSFLFAALSRVLFPSVARAGAEHKEWLVARYASQGVRLAILVTALGAAVIAATGGAALALVYRPSYAEAAAPFAMLMVAAVGRIVYSTCSDVMMARGQRRLALTIIVATTVAEVILLAVVVPAGGPVAAAAAAAVAGLAAAAWACWSLRGLLGWRVVWTFVRSSAAAAVVAAGLAIWHPHGLMLIPAYVAAAAVFTAVLGLLGEFDADDRASLRGVLWRTT